MSPNILQDAKRLFEKCSRRMRMNFNRNGIRTKNVGRLFMARFGTWGVRPQRWRDRYESGFIRGGEGGMGFTRSFTDFPKPVVIAFHIDFVIGTPANHGLTTGTAVTNDLSPLLESIAISHFTSLQLDTLPLEFFE
ncbi:hypothetical protein [Paenibacillus agricola]|uniref:Uncharacterized protein n=1 Tax=Paenibacillus agricola TaxID=2716264 RepID=A0ABX0JGN4_9BACL|nr:hypothetical protein [Paenibacillus agricola]NHN34414.1 hypothetical protein [Paenibacillus agricola]